MLYPAVVAPHAGAWIGTPLLRDLIAACARRPSCRGVDWNYSMPAGLHGGTRVAPHAGAWIGTLRRIRHDRSVREVAPHAGAWIGTCHRRLSLPSVKRRPSCRGVDWNLHRAGPTARPASPLMQGRGLEHYAARHAGVGTQRVAPHAGAWIGTLHAPRSAKPAGRPSCRGVDWNTRSCRFSTAVAPHAGAWIGTCLTPRRSGLRTQSPTQVAPHAGAWIGTCSLLG